MKLTDRTVRATLVMAREMGEAQWKHEPRGRGRGALSLKAMPGGRAHWYFRYSLDRRHQYAAIGPYGTAADEFTLEAARVRCDVLAALRDKLPGGDLRAHLEAQDAAAAAEQRKVVVAAVVAERGTLAALLGTYADGLDARGKANTAKDVRRLVKLHVTEKFPEYAAAPAKALTARQAAEMLRKVVEAGKGRTAAKVRAYLRAAYGQAQRAESDPAMPAAMLAFGVEANPIVGVATMPQFNTAADRALSEPELRALWRRLTATDTPSAGVLRLAVLLGGQRFNQLLRARVADFDADAGTLTLFDPKGRRSTPRRHVLPCPATALALLERRAEVAAALETDLLFPAANGEPVTTNTVSKFLQDVRKAMLAAKEIRADFELKDLRRTCETHLAALGVSKDVRAQIQSHGLGGVQDRHYDRHDYLVEKSKALDGWAAWLMGTSTKKVRRIRETAAA
jgi:integrase